MRYLGLNLLKLVHHLYTENNKTLMKDIKVGLNKRYKIYHVHMFEDLKY